MTDLEMIHYLMKMAAYDVDKFFTNSPPVVVLYYPPVTLRRTPSSHKTGRLIARDSLYKRKTLFIANQLKFKSKSVLPFFGKAYLTGPRRESSFQESWLLYFKDIYSCQIELVKRVRSGSVVECFTRD